MQRQFSLWVVRLRLKPNGYEIVPLACKRRPQMITERVRVTLERVRVSQSQSQSQGHDRYRVGPRKTFQKGWYLCTPPEIP